MNQRNAIALIIAKLAKIRIRISHSHTARSDMNIFTKIRFHVLKMGINMFATDYWACSKEAASFLYYKHKKTKIIMNAIDAKQFVYDSETRANMREQLNLKDKYIIGHVGNFSKGKNYNLLVDIINSLDDSYHLVLVGDGDLQNEIKKHCLC